MGSARVTDGAVTKGNAGRKDPKKSALETSKGHARSTIRECGIKTCESQIHPYVEKKRMKAVNTPKREMLEAWIMVMFLLGLPSVTHAQDVQTQVPGQAQSLFDDAVADYMAKRWDQAALKFRKAYAVLPDALFLYNQAKALQKLENYDAAISALSRARDQEERPLPPDIAAKVPSFLAELEASLAAQKLQEKEEEKPAEADAVTPTEPPPEPEEEGGLGVLGWSGVGGMVAGSGLMVVGGLLAADVSKEADRLRTEPGQTPGRFQADREAAQADQRTARIVFYSGAGLALLGAGLMAWTFLSDGEGAAGEARTRLKLGATDIRWEVTW